MLFLGLTFCYSSRWIDVFLFLFAIQVVWQGSVFKPGALWSSLPPVTIQIRSGTPPSPPLSLAQLDSTATVVEVLMRNR